MPPSLDVSVIADLDTIVRIDLFCGACAVKGNVPVAGQEENQIFYFYLGSCRGDDLNLKRA